MFGASVVSVGVAGIVGIGGIGVMDFTSPMSATRFAHLARRFAPLALSHFVVCSHFWVIGVM